MNMVLMMLMIMVFINIINIINTIFINTIIINIINTIFISSITISITMATKLHLLAVNKQTHATRKVFLIDDNLLTNDVNLNIRNINIMVYVLIAKILVYIKPTKLFMLFIITRNANLIN